MTCLELPEFLAELLLDGVKIGLARPGAPGRFKATFTEAGGGHEQAGVRAWLENRAVKSLIENGTVVPPNVYFDLRAEHVFRIAEHQVKLIAAGTFPWPVPETRDICNISYCSPNANKPLHLGHARNLSLGGALAALLRLTGYHVHETCLFSDYGIHIARAVAARKLQAGAPEPAREKGDHMAGRWYAHGSVLHDDPATGERFRRLERQVLVDYLRKDPQTEGDFKSVTSAAIEGIRSTMTRFGASFDRYFYESDSVATCHEVVAEGLQKGLLVYADDKAVLPAARREDPAAALMRPDGSPLYLLQSIASSLQRIRAFAPQKIGRYLSVRAIEQEATFQLYSEVWNDLAFPPLAGRQIISYGIVYKGNQRMRSRQPGSVILLDSVLDELEDHIEKVKKDAGSLTSNTLRFFLLSRALRDPIKFTGVEAITSDDHSFLKLQDLRVGITGIGEPERTVETASHLAFALLCCQLPAIVDYAVRHLDPTRVAGYLRSVMAAYRRIKRPRGKVTRSSACDHLFEQLTRTVLSNLAFQNSPSPVSVTPEMQLLGKSASDGI